MTDKRLAALDALPLIAILRGLTPDEAPAIGRALVEAGFRCLEVPLNSPDPLESVRRLIAEVGDRAVVGAGTVLTPQAAREVAEAGGQAVISPNMDASVVRETKALGLLSLPGVLTPTEAFAALAAGADALKLFPGEIAGPAGMKAMRAVLPRSTRFYAVGGVDATTIPDWVAAGASGFGLGSAIYKPGWSAAEVGEAARGLVAAWRAATEA